MPEASGGTPPVSLILIAVAGVEKPGNEPWKEGVGAGGTGGTVSTRKPLPPGSPSLLPPDSA